LPTDGATTIKYDSANHIMYSACASAGLWALRTSALSTAVAQKSVSPARVTLANSAMHIAGKRAIVRTKEGGLFDVTGKRLFR
jgi:hypothetical protein